MLDFLSEKNFGKKFIGVTNRLIGKIRNLYDHFERLKKLKKSSMHAENYLLGSPGFASGIIDVALHENIYFRQS